MSKFIFFLLSLFFFSNSANAIIIRDDRKYSRYIALGSKFPSYCRINLPDGGGVLIESEWVLTAAHVAKAIKALPHKIQCGEVARNVEKVIIHPGYRENGRRDIALLKLSAPIREMKPVQIYTKNDEAKQVAALVGHYMTGTGKTGHDRELKRVLRGATNLIESTNENRITFAFDSPASKDVTNLEGVTGPDDSGGPAYITQNGKLYVVGISSRSRDTNGDGIEPGYGDEDFYTRVSLYAKWINQIISGREQELSSELKKEILDSISQVIDKQAYVYGVDFTRWKTVAQSYQAAFETASTTEEFAKQVNAALDRFGVSHLNLRTPQVSADRRAGNSRSSGISGNLKKEGYEVYTVRRGSPAEAAGMRAGDLIVSVDGKPFQTGALSGKDGQQKELVIRRHKRRLQATLEIKAWKLAPDLLTWLDKQTAMISVRTFTDPHYDRNLIERFFAEASGAKTIVIDLRGNGGGNADNVCHLLDMILPSRTKAGTFVEKADVESFKKQFGREARSLTELLAHAAMTISARSVFDADAERFKNQFHRQAETMAELIKFVGPKSRKEYTGRILVVTDRSNGSGAEIFAQSVQDLKRGTIVGSGRTVGAVLLADTVMLPGKFELHIVTADYVTIKGQRIEGAGVKPDKALAPEIIGSDENLYKSLLQISATREKTKEAQTAWTVK